MIEIIILTQAAVFRAGVLSMLGSDSEIRIKVKSNLDSISESEGTNAIYLYQAIEVAVVNFMDSLENQDPVKILVIADDEQFVEKIRNSGFKTYGIVSSETSAEGLKAAIRAVDEGLCVFSRTILKGLGPIPAAQIDRNSADLDEHLTTRELMVLQQLADGKANKQIAQALGISENTVKFHIASIYTKFRVNSRMEAMIKGVQLGIVAL